MTHLTLHDLLTRTNLTMSLDEAARLVVPEFKLGTLTGIEPLYVGYEELNTLIFSSSGKYVVKFFSKDKDLDSISSNVRALNAFYTGGVPVPKLYQAHDGQYIYEVEHDPAVYLVVMDYFEGRKFTEFEPNLEDMVRVTKILSRIHALSFETKGNYDMWLTMNLVQEFAHKKQYLSLEERQLIQPVVNGLAAIDLQKLPTSIVHLDLHRENVMKNEAGDYCILDLATCTTSYSVADLATYLALFCMDGTLSVKENLRRYTAVVSVYQETSALSEYELQVLPMLILATFAANTLIPTYLQQSGTDENSEQTLYYQKLGRNGLRRLSGAWSQIS